MSNKPQQSQHAFAFIASSCPKPRTEFWAAADAAISVMWGEIYVSEYDYTSPLTNEVTKSLKVVIKAPSIKHLCDCCYEFGCQLQAFKARNKQFKFFHSLLNANEQAA